MEKSKLQFSGDYDKRGQATCKRCKQKITKGSFRLGKVTPNPFSEGTEMKQWFHPNCLFDSFASARASTAKITKPEDVEGFTQLSLEDRESLIKMIDSLESKCASSKSPKKHVSPTKIDKVFSPSKSPATVPREHATKCCIDNLFSSFCSLCSKVAAETSYKNKTSIVHDFLFRHGATNQHGYCGDSLLLLKLLLPGEKGLERVFNMNSKQMIKIFADIFGENPEKIETDVNEHGDLSIVIADQLFKKSSSIVKPVESSTLTLSDVDEFLDGLTKLTKYDDQFAALRKITRKCGVIELRYLIRLLKKDLRMNAKAAQILAAVSESAYQAFQHSRDLISISNYFEARKSPESRATLKKDISVKATLMSPIQPMLAEACKSVEFAMKKCPKGMFAEIKYDGERVQVHRNGDQFSYYSRSLKPVMPHKVSYLADAIPKAFPNVTDIILDGEIVMVDTNSHLPLPFGTLGVHKASKFKSAQVCMYVFDCMHVNGKSLMNKTLNERREILISCMSEITDRIVLSEVHKISKPIDLHNLLDHVFAEKLEGLVLKPVESLYEPGKRHWLKIKKDYLNDGAMADTADLIVLGAYFGTGNKGGLMSTFLMGVHDYKTKQFVTVTKCCNGHDDSTLARLQKELDMARINKDLSKIPSWININNQLTPDFIIRDPKADYPKAQVWEVTGAEFTKADIHTAEGISIRFPRVTRIRDDKTWETATNLEELRTLWQNSRQQSPKKSIGETNITYRDTSTTSLLQPKTNEGMKRKQSKAKLSEDESSATSGSDDEISEMSNTQSAALPRVDTKSGTKISPKLSSPTKKAKTIESHEDLDWDPPEIFAGKYFYIDKKSIKDTKDLIRCAIAYGAAGICTDVTDPQINFCLISNECASVPSSLPVSARCVRTSWLSSCVKAKSWVDPAAFVLK